MTTGAAVPAPAVAQVYRPKFIVVFHERSDRNAGILSQVRKVGQSKGIRSRAGQVVLEAKGSTGAPTKVYEALRVAATDLTDDELVELKKQGQVVAVLQNEIRSVPPMRPSSLAHAMEAFSTDGEPSAGISTGFSPEQAFVEGMSAAINAIRSFGAAGISPAPIISQPAALPVNAAAAVRRTWGLASIGITSRYRRATGKGVKVAVLDTGVNMRHPDFVGRFDEGVNAVSFVNGQGVQDGHGHGTHTTGTVAGPSRSVGGIRYGVAPDADIFSGKVLSNRGSGSDDTIIEGIDWARDQGCKVISMSLGSAREPGEPFSAAYESLAQQLLDDGVLIVAAAGNESDRPDILAPVGNPAACPSILAVAAIDRRLGIADFSCRKVDPIGEVNISGPGVAVYSAFKGNQFVTLDGTSMATPHVAGAAALFLETNPQLTARELWRSLVDGARSLGSTADFGSGELQVP